MTTSPTPTEPHAPPAQRAWPASPRQTVQARLPDGRIFEGPSDATLEAFLEAAGPWPAPIMAGSVDGRLRELSYPLAHDAAIEPLSMATGDGMRIYQRSLTFLLVVAVHEIFPDAGIIVDHAIVPGGFFCQVAGRPPFDAAELARIETRMREIVNANETIERRHVPVEEARRIFETQQYDDKLRLLQENRSGRTELSLYSLRGVHDYFYGYMLPSAGYLQYFALRPTPGGFVLLFPRREHPTQLAPYPGASRLTEVFRQHVEAMQVMGVEDVAALNAAVAEGRLREIVLVSEALHERRVAEIAGKIAAGRGRIRVVLIAGPSSAGKTTFSKRLAVQLLSAGIRPIAIGLDDYFVDRARTPRDENGTPDFEALEAVDTELFNQHLLQLLAGQEVQLPSYNFQAGQREAGRRIAISADHVILIEGIHGLNPKLTLALPGESIHRIYISALTQLNLDNHNRIPTTDTRLIRRIVRDAAFRGYPALNTIMRWESVQRGENRNIYPYQDNADDRFNSALLYELAILKPLVEPLLRQIEPYATAAYSEAHRLLSFLSWFLPSPATFIPDNSLLREFIGGSSLADFRY